MPLPLLALAAAPAIAKGLLGAYQLTQDVKRVDTTTPAEREQLALARQASAATMPGLTGMQARLAQVQGATIQNAQLGAGSGSDFLAAGAAAASTRQAGENALGVQQARYRDVASQQLSQALSQQAARQRADTERANQAQAALTGSGLTNLFGGLSDGASVAAYGASGGDMGAAGGGGAAGFTQALNRSPYGPGDYPSGYRQGLRNPLGAYYGAS